MAPANMNRDLHLANIKEVKMIVVAPKTSFKAVKLVKRGNSTSNLAIMPAPPLTRSPSDYEQSINFGNHTR